MVVPTENTFSKRREEHILRAAELQRSGKLNEAFTVYSEVLEYQPEDDQVLYALATILDEKQEYELARQLYLHAIQRNPNIESYHISLGKMFTKQRHYEHAIACFHFALEIHPKNVHVLLLLGDAYIQQSLFREAITTLHKALVLQKEHAEVHAMLGGAYAKCGEYEKAIHHSAIAVTLDNRNTTAYNTLAFVYGVQNNFQKAIEWYDTALRLAPHDPALHVNKGTALLKVGDFENGWKEFEWRLHKENFKQQNRFATAPNKWNGDALNGKKILVWCEQGLGDTIQCVRYLPLIKERGGYIIFECQRELIPLLKEYPGIDEMRERFSVEDNAFDVHIPLMSLPMIFYPSVGTMQAEEGYIHADTSLQKTWSEKISTTKIKIGIVWQGSALNKSNSYRSCSVDNFTTLAELNNVQLFSLQHINNEVPLPSTIIPLHDNGFSDLAAIIASLDLVISIDTAVAHLAGALGCPVWVALSEMHDWRWMAEKTETQWYPSMKLFRQKKFGDWDSVFSEMALAITNVEHQQQTAI